MNYKEAEKWIRHLFMPGTTFVYDGEEYVVIMASKPRKSAGRGGEPKTDIYLLCKNQDGQSREIKISYKKENAEFIENKITVERAEQIFGSNWRNRLSNLTESIQDSFRGRRLIYRKDNAKKGSITLGWRLDLMNKPGGLLSVDAKLTKEEKVEVYSGRNLPDRLKNAKVNKQIVINSGVADYMVNKDGLKSAQDVIDNMIPIADYVDAHPDVYITCKALNYRSFSKKKVEGDRALLVQVIWAVRNDILCAKLNYANPLEISGKEQESNLLKCLAKLSAKNTDDLGLWNVEEELIYE